MTKLLEWFTQNQEVTVGLITAVLLFIAKVTPTPKDDKWFAWFLAKTNMLPETAVKVREEKIAIRKSQQPPAA